MEIRFRTELELPIKGGNVCHSLIGAGTTSEPCGKKVKSDPYLTHTQN